MCRVDHPKLVEDFSPENQIMDQPKIGSDWNIGIHGEFIKGNQSLLLAERFRLVNYSNLPRPMVISIHLWSSLFIFGHSNHHAGLTPIIGHPLVNSHITMV